MAASRQAKKGRRVRAECKGTVYACRSRGSETKQKKNEKAGRLNGNCYTATHRRMHEEMRNCVNTAHRHQQDVKACGNPRTKTASRQCLQEQEQGIQQWRA